MSRESSDEIRDGAVYNGYDYRLQVWVKDGQVQDCAHPGHCTCAARAFAGVSIANISGHEIR